MQFDFDSIVIGAGVIGLAVANALANSGRSVLVVEQEDGIGTGISSRNSEVIHAGIYYPHGSLKRRLCVEGKTLLVNHCRSHHVNFKLLGKLIVATNEAQENILPTIYENGIRNGVSDLRIVSGQDLNDLEMNLRARSAIFSPSTGVVDSHGFMLSLQGCIERQGGILVFRSPVTKITKLDYGFSLVVGGDEVTEITSREVINSSGFSSQGLSEKITKIKKNSIPISRYCKGTYFSLGCESPFSKLIYPIPNDAGLGIHLTLDLAGRAKFGPDTEWVERPEYNVDEARRDMFYAAIKEYYPSLDKYNLLPDYVGVRPKVVRRGEPASDFIIQFGSDHGLNGYVALYGMESPGLTASLAIGKYVESKL
ncbi:MAG: NAD(P)/FAD-dependent oxidoreductase [Porticoccaceae bacterium]|nr:NAD(P)/FAD-dependent oxidoreductase [Porticoccaceae bacterium]